MACLDSSAIFDLYGRGGVARQRDVTHLLEATAIRGEPVRTSIFTIAEFEVGLHRSARPEREEALLREVEADFDLLPFDRRCAAIFGEVKSHLLTIGRPVGDMDVLIAATTLAHGERLITRNSRHFADVPGLAVEAY